MRNRKQVENIISYIFEVFVDKYCLVISDLMIYDYWSFDGSYILIKVLWIKFVLYYFSLN